MTNMILGFILWLDGVLSMILVKDKKFVWQVARLIRMTIGAYILFYGLGEYLGEL